MDFNNGIAYGTTKLVNPTGIHKATIVWLHDIGETGLDSARFVRKLKLPNIKWICPTAPRRPVSLLGGQETTAWSDVTQISENMQDDLVSINTTTAFVASLLCNEPEYVMKGIGGIGVGAAEALYFASGYVSGGTPYMNLNVIVGMNGWLPARRNFEYHIASGTVAANLAASLPVLFTNDITENLVPYAFGYRCYESLRMAGFPIMFTPTDGRDPTIVRNWLTEYLQL